MKLITSILILAYLIGLPVEAYTQDRNFMTHRLSMENGLTQSDISSIVQDSTGFMWFGTHNGLNRYDGHRITQYKHSLDSTKNSLLHNVIQSMASDKEDNIWIVTKAGIDRYNIDRNTFYHYISYYNTGKEFPFTDLYNIHCTQENEIFLCTNNGLCMYDKSTDRFVLYSIDGITNTDPINIRNIQSDVSTNSLFISTSKGVFQYEKSGKKTIRHSTGRSSMTCYIPFNKKLLMSVGDNLYAKSLESGIIETVEYERKSIGSVSALLPDSSGNVWIGTTSGLYIWDGKNVKKYGKDKHILSLFRDKDNNIWIGKSTDGVETYSLSPKMFKTYPGFPNVAVYSIYAESQDSIWVETKEGILYLIDRKNDAIKEMKKFPNSGMGYIYPHYDKNKLWISVSSGLYLYDKNTGDFVTINGIQKCGYVNSLCMDKDSVLWLASRNGLFTYKDNQINKIYPVVEAKNNKNSCRSVLIDNDTIWAGFAHLGIVKILKQGGKYNVVIAPVKTLNFSDISVMQKDSYGHLLVGTWGGGINILKGDSTEYLTEDEGLSDNIIFSIYEDRKRKLWISTYNGLSCYDPVTKHVENYKIRDELPSNEFSVGAHYFFNNDEIFLGTINGVTSFHPSDIDSFRSDYKIVLSDMYIFDQKIRVGQVFKGKTILNKPIYETSKISLPAHFNSISFDIADFNYKQSLHSAVKYRLKGWDTKWNNLPENSKISFSNLSPGYYELIIYKQSADGKWSADKLLDIRIRPPYYASVYAFILYGILLILIVAKIYSYLQERNKLRRLLFEKETQKKYQEKLFVTRMKFYTNISHELRTPLTLIIGMLERIGNMANDNQTMTNHINIARKNADKLHILINDILDFRKIDTENMMIKKENKNIVSFLQTVVSYFKEVAETKNIVVEAQYSCDVFICSFDIDKTEKIIYNLLSNAIKYTTDKIEVILDVKNEDTNPSVEIKVKDNGKGISKDEQKSIFERFYQGSNSEGNEGTGIGLSLACELAKLQGGDISVESEINVGTVFTFSLPVNKVFEKPSVGTAENSGKPIVLIVDDNENMLYYMGELLADEYTLYKANNGQQALDIAFKIIPDMIICDIMMPDISGIEVCKQIKTSPITCQTAVILISARGVDQVSVEGLSQKADTYISKPFSEVYFKAQIKSLIENKNVLKEQIYRDMMKTRSNNENIQDTKDKLLQKIIICIEDNLSDSNYDVEQLSNDIGMSRMSLYRKMKTCVGQTPSEFIKQYKLKKAAEQILYSDSNITEICYNFGYNDVKTFRVAFKKEFGMSPSEYKKRIHQHENCSSQALCVS